MSVMSSTILGRSPEQVAASVASNMPVRKRQSHWLIAWTFLLLACMGASCFAYQYFLVPEPPLFTPPCQGAQWVQARDGNASVPYFRDAVNFNPFPDHDFLSLAAN